MARRFIRRAFISIRSACAGPSALEALGVVAVGAFVTLPLAALERGERGVRVGIGIDGPVTRADVNGNLRGELLELMGEEIGLEVPPDAIDPSD